MFKFFVITIMGALFLMSCGGKTATDIIVNDNDLGLQIDYIVDDDLSSESYSDVNGYFPQEGLIPTAGIAFQMAELIMCQLYGKDKIEQEKPFSVNLENDIWIIEGHLDNEFLGGVTYMEIRKTNGEILKIIHTK